MLIELIFNSLFGLFEYVIELLPTVAFSLPKGIFDIGYMLFENIGYVLPMTALLPLFTFFIALDGFKLIMAIIVRIKSFIPTMGA